MEFKCRYCKKVFDDEIDAGSECYCGSIWCSDECADADGADDELLYCNHCRDED